MRKVLCIDYNYYLLPEGVDLNQVMGAVQHPVSREYATDGNVIVFRSLKKAVVSLELIDEVCLDPPMPAASEPEL
jgi:glycine cleavage system protein P-like pyridoxal-binding family